MLKHRCTACTPQRLPFRKSFLMLDYFKMMQCDSSFCCLTLDVLGIAWPCLYRLLHPPSPLWKNDRSEGLRVPLSLVHPACWYSPVMKNIPSATPYWVKKPSLKTCPSLSVRCLFPFLAQFVSCCMALWWKGLWTGPVWSTAMASVLADVWMYSREPECFHV